jgi:hypothetical protein
VQTSPTGGEIMGKFRKYGGGGNGKPLAGRVAQSDIWMAAWFRPKGGACRILRSAVPAASCRAFLDVSHWHWRSIEDSLI